MDELSFYAQEAIEETFKRAEHIYGRSFKRPSFDFRQKGCIAGTAAWSGNSISLNRALFQQNTDDFIKWLIPHECAHLICDEVYPFERKKHHGPAWQSVMRELGLEPKRCHNYDVSSVKRRKSKLKRFKYTCPCSTQRELTQIRHNKLQANPRAYVCSKCRGKLELLTGWWANSGHVIPVGKYKVS